MYSPSGITNEFSEDRRGDPSSLGFEEESSSAATAAPSFGVNSGLVLMCSDLKECFLRCLLLPMLPSAFINGGDDVNGSRYNLAMANGIMTAAAAAAVSVG